MLLTLGLAAGLIRAPAGAVAAEKPAALQKAFTHTIVSTYPDGRIAKLWMDPSGTFTSMGRRHDRHAGRWTLKGDKVCFRRGLGSFCTPVPTEKAFTTKAVTGETIQVRLAQPGRDSEKAGSGTSAPKSHHQRRAPQAELTSRVQPTKEIDRPGHGRWPASRAVGVSS